MSTTFSTWTAAFESLKDQFASANARLGSVTVGGKTVTYKSNQDFIALLEYAQRMAQFESGSYSPRVYAKNGGKASC